MKQIKLFMITVTLMMVSLLSGCSKEVNTINVDREQLENSVDQVVSIQGFMSPIMSMNGKFGYIMNNPYSTDVMNGIGMYLKDTTEYSQTAIEVTGKLKKATEKDYDLVYVIVDNEIGYIQKSDFTSDKKKYCKENGINYDYVYTDGSTNIFKYKLTNCKAELLEFEEGTNNYLINHMIEHGYPGVMDLAFTHVYETLNGSKGNNNSYADSNSIDIESVAITKLDIATDSNTTAEDYITGELSEYQLEDLYTLRSILSEEAEVYKQPLEITNNLIRLINNIESKNSESEYRDYNIQAEELYKTFIEYISDIQLE